MEKLLLSLNIRVHSVYMPQACNKTSWLKPRGKRWSAFDLRKACSNWFYLGVSISLKLYQCSKNCQQSQKVEKIETRERKGIGTITTPMLKQAQQHLKPKRYFHSSLSLNFSVPCAVYYSRHWCLEKLP